MTGEGAAPSGAGNAAERLRRLQQLGVRRGRAGLAAPAPAQPPPAAPFTGRQDDLAARVGAEEVITRAGPCLVATRSYPLDERRGGWPLGEALAVRGAAVAACSRDPRLASFDFHQAAFLDTETSGLAGGTGTFAFMVGIGTFEPGRYVVRQVFMRNPAEERALLSVVGELLARGRALVTFNGRSFDAPLLNTRYALQREPSPLVDLPHFDLLPAARQRWRLRLPSCALGALEHDILDFQRSQQDVPGWLIPSIYQEYARSQGQTRPEVLDDMARVFYHNGEDIVSMAPLAAMLCAPFDPDQAGTTASLPAADWVSLGRCYEELDWQEASETAYRRALEAGLPAELRGLALRRLGWLLKRQERRAEAVAVWHDWITSVPGPDVTPYEELAKHHEWQEVDLAAARKWTLWGLHTARQLPHGPAREEALSSLQHRLERLERKLAE